MRVPRTRARPTPGISTRVTLPRSLRGSTSASSESPSSPPPAWATRRRRAGTFRSAAAACPEKETMDLGDADLAARISHEEEVPDWFTYPEVIAILRTVYPPPREQGITLFFTGLSGSGKSTLAKIMYGKFIEEGRRSVTLLDGDIVRHHLSSELGFSKPHRDLNVRRIGFVASEITKNGGVAICAPIAPYAGTRRDVREMIEAHGAMIEIHVCTPLEVCEARDPQRALREGPPGAHPRVHRYQRSVRGTGASGDHHRHDRPHPDAGGAGNISVSVREGVSRSEDLSRAPPRLAPLVFGPGRMDSSSIVARERVDRVRMGHAPLDSPHRCSDNECSRFRASSPEHRCGSPHVFGGVVGRCMVLETGEPAQEREIDLADGTVALLADDDFSLPLVLALLVVDLVAIDEQDQVRILLDRAGLTQVGHHRALVLTILEAPVELRARHHRHHQLLCECLQRSRYLGDLRRSILARSRYVHELEVVDHDEPDTSVLALEPPASSGREARSASGRIHRR